MRVAKTYQNGYKYDETKAYEKDGKLYVDASCKCDRCVKGVFVCRIENGQPVPHPAYGGVCLKCGGTGYISKSIRLYTNEEYERMEKANEKAREKRRAEQEERMKREFAHRKEIWLETHGFNKNEETYIVLGDSYSIKDQLKDAGFRYNGTLHRWMKGEPIGIPQDYKGDVIKVSATDILEFSAWGEGHFFSNAKEIIDNIEKETLPEVITEWKGEIGERLTVKVFLAGAREYQNQWGYGIIYTFKDDDNGVYVWFTKVDINKEVGDSFTLVGTVKDHKTYNDIHQTIVNRCKIK